MRRSGAARVAVIFMPHSHPHPSDGVFAFSQTPDGKCSALLDEGNDPPDQWLFCKRRCRLQGTGNFRECLSHTENTLAGLCARKSGGFGELFPVPGMDFGCRPGWVRRIPLLISA